ncbi:MAG TPA: response regulator, partial [Burkholderiaceae bacterium]
MLIVDDEAAQMQALCDTLSDHGYATVGCSDGAAALAALQQAPFDLLLADLMMPGMNGIALLRAALQTDPMLVGIIMTGEGTI